jgi:hypothetical protein
MVGMLPVQLPLECLVRINPRFGVVMKDRRQVGLRGAGDGQPNKSLHRSGISGLVIDNLSVTRLSPAR